MVAPVTAEEEPELIGTSTAAAILGWTPRKVQRAANTGQIPIIGTVGPQHNRVFRKDVIEEIARQKHEQ